MNIEGKKYKRKEKIGKKENKKEENRDWEEIEGRDRRKIR